MSSKPPKDEATDPDKTVGVKGKKRRFFQVDNRIIDEWGKIIGSDGVAIYCLLERKANSETGVAWMGQTWIAEHLCLCEETVSVVLGDLEQLGLITVERQREASTGRISRTLYTVVEPVPACTLTKDEAPRKKRSDERKERRKIAKALEAPLENMSVPLPDHPEQFSVDGTKPISSPSPNCLVALPLTVRGYKDSLRDKDSVRNTDEARGAPVLSLLPGNEEGPAFTNGPLPSTTVSEEPPPPAPSRPPSPTVGLTAGSSALAPSVEWDDLQAAPDSVRHGPITFPDDVDGWCQALIWLTTGWTATKFFATKPKTEHDKYWGQAKQHFQKGHHVPVLLDKYQPGGWWYTLNVWKERRPTLHEISATWGDWDQEPVPFGPAAPPPANVREEWKPVEVQVHTFTPDQTAAMRQKFLQEARHERERKDAERKSTRPNGRGAV